MKYSTRNKTDESKSFNSEHKLFIREYWNKPLLKFLTHRISDKLVYLGLPSPKAEDILEWIEYIKNVIAFQCRIYGKVSTETQSREGIIELNEILTQIERENKIDSFVIFDGYLEEVILKGKDNSPSQISVDLSDFVTLYNLDFCNSITSPINYVDIEGNLKTAYKFDAIKRLLEIQKSLCKISNKFVLFLTVHCSYKEIEIRNFMTYPPSEEVRSFIQKYNDLSRNEKNARIIRLFFVYYIRQQFEAFGFTPKILPSLYYNGLGGTPLLHFTVFGINTNIKNAGVPPNFQSLTAILNQKFISIKNSRFINKNIDCEGEIDVELNPVKLFSESRTFLNLWSA